MAGSKSVSKKLLSKAAASKKANTSGKLKAVSKPLPDESSSEGSDFDDDDLEDDSEEDDEEEEEEDGEEGESSDEEEDVTEEALERMMELLGDDAELAMLEATGGEEEEDEEEGSDEEDEEEGSDEEELEEDDEEDAEIEYEDLEQEDGDIVPVEKTTVNDKSALTRVLASFKSDTTFFDTLTLTHPKDLDIPDASNDLQRELEFYKQSLWAAQHAESLFEEASLPFTRPNDYFAEMIKSDAHMSRIRQGLLDESAGIKASEDARKLRDAKKFGKKVQVERLKEREKEKKEVGKRLDSLKKKRKNGDGGFSTTEDFDIALEDAIAGPSKKRKVVESERKKGMSRRGRDSKFGRPTDSRRPKENNDRLDGDGFGGAKRGRAGGRGGGRGGFGRGGGRGGASRGGAKRLGKSRRN